MRYKRKLRRKVQKVIDGDTFKVRKNVVGSQYIRMAGVNAPEKRQQGYMMAKNRLKKRIEGKIVTITPVGKSYGRTVGKVTYRRKRLSR